MVLLIVITTIISIFAFILLFLFLQAAKQIKNQRNEIAMLKVIIDMITDDSPL